jgi:hypothetical protein
MIKKTQKPHKLPHNKPRKAPSERMSPIESEEAQQGVTNCESTSSAPVATLSSGLAAGNSERANAPKNGKR